jgi:acyl-homoserine-lactone acylase
MHIKIILFVMLLALSLGSHCSTPNEQQYTQTEILWDTWGVPHIYASTEADLYYAFGWAQMHNHGNLIASLYGQARGRGAEYWGEAYLQTDHLLHNFNFPAMAVKALESLPEKEVKLIEAFVEGLNAYFKEKPHLIATDMHQVFPLQTVDILAHSYRVIYLEFMIRRNLGPANRWSAGSNAWAIGPQKSTSGHAMLVTNPHLGWSDFWMFMEAHLNTPDFMLYGNTLVGMPYLTFAFNNHLGWTHTVNPIDNVDLYELKLQDGKYLLDGQALPFDERMALIRVKQQDGSLRTDTLRVRSSRHGVVIREENNKALALRFAGMGEALQISNQWYSMGQATNFEEFEAAMKTNQTPLFNVLYADRDGNIFYGYGGHVPKRNQGNWGSWAGIVPGDSSENIWHGWHEYETLPRLLNPSTGWLQNANDPPFTSTIPQALDPVDFPTYLAPNYMALRPQQSARLLMQDDQISFERLIELQQNNSVLLADRILDDLLALLPQVSDSLGMAAMDVLAKWDRTFSADSRGAVLFLRWVQVMAGNNFNALFETPWDPQQPVTTPTGIRNKERAVNTLAESAKIISQTYGSLDVPYGDVYRLRVGEYDLPANGGAGFAGLFRTLEFSAADNNTFEVVHGESYVAITEFGEQVRAKVLLTYGNATQPHSPHVGDQLPLFAEKKLRDAWLSREEVEGNLAKREVLVRGE